MTYNSKFNEIKEKFDDINEDDLNNLSFDEVLEYYSYKKRFINENEDDIVFEEIGDREEYLKKSGQLNWMIWKIN